MSDPKQSDAGVTSPLEELISEACKHLALSGSDAAKVATAVYSPWAERYARLRDANAKYAPNYIRTLHHMACTGGTLISKALQAQPNAILLSEVDPFSTIPRDHQHRGFAPSDLILLARSGLFDIDCTTIENMFIGALEALHQSALRRGQYVTIRDHSHSQFCTEQEPASRPCLHDLIARHFSVKSVVSVRHPIDSWASLNANGWQHFVPYTLEEYCRRYWRFLDAYDGVEVFKYEDFVAAPDQIMKHICDLLSMPYNASWKMLLPAIKLTGDSGRSSNHITARPRRALPEEVAIEATQSPAYERLCDRLGYQCEVETIDAV